MRNRISFFSLGIIVLVSLCNTSFAAKVREEKGPCARIAKACGAAGFKKSGNKMHKGMWAECMNPILSGQKISGVTVNASDVDACNTMKAKSN